MMIEVKNETAKKNNISEKARGVSRKTIKNNQNAITKIKKKWKVHSHHL